MEGLLEYFSHLSPETIYFYYLSLLAVTLTGVIPNNVEVTILVGGILAGMGKFSFLQVFFGVVLTVLLIENSLFQLGRYFGDYFFKIPLYKKILSDERRRKLGLGIEKHPYHSLLSLRITPLFRPVFFVALGSVKTRTFTFFRVHGIISFIYYAILLGISYQFTHLIQYYFKNYFVLILVLFILLWVIVSKALSKKFISL